MVKETMGHADVKTTEIWHVMEKEIHAVEIPNRPDSIICNFEILMRPSTPVIRWGEYSSLPLR